MSDYPLPAPVADPDALITELVAAHTAWVGVGLAESIVIDGDVIRFPDWLDVDPEVVGSVTQTR